MHLHIQWRIQDFPQGGAPTPKSAIIFQFFAENCMKMKEFGPPGGARVPGAPLGSANDIYIYISFKRLLSILMVCNHVFHTLEYSGEVLSYFKINAHSNQGPMMNS